MIDLNKLLEFCKDLSAPVRVYYNPFDELLECDVYLLGNYFVLMADDTLKKFLTYILDTINSVDFNDKDHCNFGIDRKDRAVTKLKHWIESLGDAE